MQYCRQDPSKLTLNQLKVARLYQLYKRLNELQSNITLNFNAADDPPENAEILRIKKEISEITLFDHKSKNSF